MACPAAQSRVHSHLHALAASKLLLLILRGSCRMSSASRSKSKSSRSYIDLSIYQPRHRAATSRSACDLAAVPLVHCPPVPTTANGQLVIRITTAMEPDRKEHRATITLFRKMIKPGTDAALVPYSSAPVNAQATPFWLSARVIGFIMFVKALGLWFFTPCGLRPSVLQCGPRSDHLLLLRHRTMKRLQSFPQGDFKSGCNVKAQYLSKLTNLQKLDATLSNAIAHIHPFLPACIHVDNRMPWRKAESKRKGAQRVMATGSVAGCVTPAQLLRSIAHASCTAE